MSGQFRSRIECYNEGNFVVVRGQHAKLYYMYEQQTSVVQAQAVAKLREMLNELHGLPLTCVCHAMNLAMFDFGRKNKVKTNSGFEFYSDYALHIQCGWQLSRGEAIIAGSADYAKKLSAEFPGVSTDDESLLTYRFRELMKSLGRKFIIEAAESDSGGRLTIRFQNEYRLQVLPLTSTHDAETEFWRLIETAGEGAHGVVGATGCYISKS